MFNTINKYVIIQILKSCTLIFFIFISITWLLQITRLFALSNLIQIDFFNVIYLSLFLIPNLSLIITPFIIIFGILLCFNKLHRDQEIISFYSLGLTHKPFKLSLFVITVLIIIIYSSLTFLISPIIYEKYKYKEFDLRNKINFEQITISNFLELNSNTIIDFKKENNQYNEIYINFSETDNNIIYANSASFDNRNEYYNIELRNGFKLSFNEKDPIEKLEFNNYLLKIKNNKNIKFDNIDKNTLTLFDDIRTENYLNIIHKIFDIFIIILLVIFFYFNNIIPNRFDTLNNSYFIILSIFILLSNQLTKNMEINLILFLCTNIFIICTPLIFYKIKPNNNV